MLGARHRERAYFTGFDLLHHGRRLAENHADFAGQQRDRAGPPPLYGTWTIFVFVIIVKSAPVR